MPALRRSAPTVRFITFDTLATGVRAFECALSVFTSSFVHGLMTRRADFTAFTGFALFTAFFKALGITQVLQLNRAHIVARRGDNKANCLDGHEYRLQLVYESAASRQEKVRRVVHDENTRDQHAT